MHLHISFQAEIFFQGNLERDDMNVSSFQKFVQVAAGQHCKMLMGGILFLINDFLLCL